MEKRRVSDLLIEQRADSWFERTVVANAPTIMGWFANIVVVIADVRAYDVVYRLTESWWKALSASLACAVPFVLWEIAWQYNHTTETWRRWSLVMAGFAFATSLFLGVADFLNFTGIWTNWLLGGVVVATGAHTVMGFLYYYNDPDVARRRFKAQALGSMQDQQLNAAVTENLLENGQALLAFMETLGNRFSVEEVEKIMSILQGKRFDKPSAMRPAYAQTAVRAETAKQSNWYTLDEFAAQIGMTKGQIKAAVVGCKNHDEALKKLVIDRGKLNDTDISGKNFRKLYYGEINPQKAERARP